MKSPILSQCLAIGLLFFFSGNVRGQSGGQSTYLASTALPPESQLHTTVQDDHRIVINSDGVSEEAPEYPEQLRTMFHHIAQQSSKRLLVFIHGGLTSLAAANNTAKNLGPKIERSDPNTYAIFLNWDSGLVSSYGRHLLYERNGISYKGTPSASVAVAIFPFVLLSDIGRGISNLSMNTALNIGKLMENVDWVYQPNPRSFPTKDKFFETLREFSGNPDASQAEDSFFRAGLEYVPASRGPAINLFLGPDYQHQKWGLLAKNSATIPLQFVTEPLLDTVGTSAWKNMLRRTRTMFYPAGNFITVSGVTRHPHLYPGAAYSFFDQLQTFLQEHPNYCLDVVGYSMGAIVMNEALRYFPDLRIRNLVYMGAACSLRDFNVAGGAYLKRSGSTQFYDLCLHPRAELDEANVGGIPVRGSLLTWIDEFFQTPESFGDRTLGTFENAVIAHQLLPQSGQVHLKAFGMNEGQFGKGCSPGPQKHGEFCNYEFWNPLYWRTDVPLNESYRLIQ